MTVMNKPTFCVTSIYAVWHIGIASSSHFVASAGASPSVIATLCIPDSISKMACQIFLNFISFYIIRFNIYTQHKSNYNNLHQVLAQRFVKIIYTSI